MCVCVSLSLSCTLTLTPHARTHSRTRYCLLLPQVLQASTDLDIVGVEYVEANAQLETAMAKLDATQNEAGYVCVCLSVCMFPPLPNSLSVSLSLSFSLTLYSYPYHNQQIRHLDPDFRRLCCKYRGRGRCRWCSNNILRRKARQTHARIPRTSTPSHQ